MIRNVSLIGLLSLLLLFGNGCKSSKVGNENSTVPSSEETPPSQNANAAPDVGSPQPAVAGYWEVHSEEDDIILFSVSLKDVDGVEARMERYKHYDGLWLWIYEYGKGSCIEYNVSVIRDTAGNYIRDPDRPQYWRLLDCSRCCPAPKNFELGTDQLALLAPYWSRIPDKAKNELRPYLAVLGVQL
jgi:hypothetical protein